MELVLESGESAGLELDLDLTSKRSLLYEQMIRSNRQERFDRGVSTCRRVSRTAADACPGRPC
jgi:hypothetical protein